MTDSRANLIAQVQTLVRTGAVLQMDLPSGLNMPDIPVCILSLTPEWLWWLFVQGDHAHGFEVTDIRKGDDGVLVEGKDGELAEISTCWQEAQYAQLDLWLEGTRTEMIYLPVNPPPPDIVRYEGRRR